MKYIINTKATEQTPIGYILAYDGNEVPDGWLACEGQILSQADYLNLFEVIGTSHNRQYKVKNQQRRWFQFWKPKHIMITEDMPGLFRLPDLRGRIVS